MRDAFRLPLDDHGRGNHEPGAKLFAGISGKGVCHFASHVATEFVGGLVLGDKAEEAFRQSLLASQGNLGVFFSNGLVGSIMVLGLIALFWPIIQNAWTRLRPATVA